MTLTRIAVYSFVCLTITNCSTMLEGLSPSDSTQGYRAKKDGSGKYVRRRIIRNPIFVEDREPSFLDNPNEQELRRIRRADSGVEAISVVTAAVDSPGPSGFSLGVSTSIADTDSNFHLGMELETPFASGWVTGRAGLSIFSSDYLYAGGTLGARVTHPTWRVSPYVGVEAYLGDHKQCQYEDLDFGDQLETCEKVFLATLYSEIGLRVRLTDHAKLYLFTRGYSKVDQTIREDIAMFYGASLFFGY